MKSSIGGLEFEVRAFVTAEAHPSRQYHGARVHDGRALEVIAWHDEANAAATRPALAAAFQSIVPLDPAARSALRDQLRATADPQFAVGSGHSLRRGVYRDFERGLTWTKPAGWWDVTVGAAARAIDPDALFCFWERETGLSGVLYEWALDGGSPAELHRRLVERLEPRGEVAAPTSMDLRGTPALATELHPGFDDEEGRWLVVTAPHGDRLYELAIRGSERNFDSARAQVDAAARALDFPVSLVKQESVGGRHVDHRFGFSLDLPDAASWRASESSLAGFQEVAAFVSLERGKCALRAGAIGSDDQADLEMLRELVIDSLVRRSSSAGSPSIDWPSTLAGLPARMIEVSSKFHINAWFANDESRIYFLVAGSWDPDESLEPLAEAFRLLDD